METKQRQYTQSELREIFNVIATQFRKLGFKVIGDQKSDAMVPGLYLHGVPRDPNKGVLHDDLTFRLMVVPWNGSQVAELDIHTGKGFWLGIKEVVPKRELTIQEIEELNAPACLTNSAVGEGEQNQENE